jgi:hypothetical protein
VSYRTRVQQWTELSIGEEEPAGLWEIYVWISGHAQAFLIAARLKIRTFYFRWGSSFLSSHRLCSRTRF